MGALRGCKHAFKLRYLDGVQQESNPFFQRGTDVHRFHENFLKRLKVKRDNLTVPEIPEKELQENEDYKKNIVKYHIDRWHKCLKQGGTNAAKYFLPILVEEKIHIPHLEVIGIPDVIERGFDDKPVPVEVKTGSPNAKKIKDYKHDLIWYKLLFEAKYPGEYKHIEKGVIYFPENNYTYTHKLKDTDILKLSKEICQARKEIVRRIEEKDWPASPKKKNCCWCGYRNSCEEKCGR